MSAHIHIETEVLPTEYHWSPLAPMRGTEEFYVETAKHLAASGYRVTVAYDGPSVPVGAATFTKRGVIKEADVLLDCNARIPWRRRGFLTGKAVAWTNFFDAKTAQYADYEKLLVISRFHKRLADSTGSGATNTTVVPHGIDKDAYQASPLLPKRDVAIYTSSMDRGGFLLQKHRDKIEHETGCLLLFSNYGKADALSEREMRMMYATARWWIHPGMGVELFCLAGAKAQAAGCVPIVRPTMALGETVTSGWQLITDEEDDFIDGIVSVMRDRKPACKANYLGPPNADHIPTWQEATRLLETALMEI